MELQPHQQRVVTEKAELDEKIQKLAQFFDNNIFHGQPEAERNRLYQQHRAMTTYSTILGERIANF